MANALYDKGRQKFLAGDLDWDAHTIRCVLVDLADYTPDLTAHEFLSSVPAIGRVATSAPLSGKTVTNGVADADNLTFTAVTGDSVEAMVMYRDAGSDATNALIAYFDTGVGIPFTPSGADFIVVWDDGPNRIFKL
jgi:hypothetical protein